MSEISSFKYYKYNNYTIRIHRHTMGRKSDMDTGLEEWGHFYAIVLDNDDRVCFKVRKNYAESFPVGNDRSEPIYKKTIFAAMTAIDENSVLSIYNDSFVSRLLGRKARKTEDCCFSYKNDLDKREIEELYERKCPQEI